MGVLFIIISKVQILAQFEFSEFVSISENSKTKTLGKIYRFIVSPLGAQKGLTATSKLDTCKPIIP